MDEFALIEQFFTGRGVCRDDVLLGIGDDAAITCPDNNFELVIATDTICEGTHFLPGTPPQALGHRCLAVNLSDLAAMGAEPLWCALALSLPKAEPDWVRQFADGFFAIADRFGMALIGGDTVCGPLAVTVTVHGRVKPGQSIRRNGAQEGDSIYVTGVPGLAAAGLRVLTASGVTAKAGVPSVQRFLYPEPRVLEGRALSGLATAMIDVSDGLIADVSRLLEASGLGAEMDLASLPLAAVGTDDALELALNGGDDYELCFCVPPGNAAELKLRITDWSCPVTQIGTVQPSDDIVWFIDGQPCNTVASQFKHFS
ncbi:MAG: thiamine-phosphate kinase [Gammaproteobacteria bacterium]|jgi:thiamine-monophosphate kinase|nr:thiamine-phosphate kinase [Chromatiales bacterium]MDP6675471.1 thiamine-phosphate kinase [Gammaproteobacteria bacterium]